MKIKDIDINSDKYDLQRGKEVQLCIMMWDYEALAQDIKLCEDYDYDTVTLDILRLTQGKCNPGSIHKVLKRLNNE